MNEQLRSLCHGMLDKFLDKLFEELGDDPDVLLDVRLHVTDSVSDDVDTDDDSLRIQIYNAEILPREDGIWFVDSAAVRESIDHPDGEEEVVADWYDFVEADKDALLEAEAQEQNDRLEEEEALQYELEEEEDDDDEEDDDIASEE